MRSLIDPRLRSHLLNHYTSRCTLATVTYSTTTSGQKVRSGNSPISGLVHIPCQLGPIIEIRPTDNQLRSDPITEVQKQRQCKLLGYFPMAVPYAMEAIVDGEVFRIDGVEADSVKFSTRLRLEVVKP